MRRVMWNCFLVKKFADWYTYVTFVETIY